MKAIIKVTGLMVLASAAFFALNAGSALAGPPPPFDEVIDPHVPFDPGFGVDLPSLCEVTDICGELAPIDPCVLLGTCGADDAADDPADATDGGDEDMVIDPTSTPTDEPTATPTDEPTATPTDEPTATPTDEPTTAPTDEPTTAPTDAPPTIAPQPGNLPHAGDDGSMMNGVSGGVVLLAGISLGAMALGWVMFFASRKAQTQR